MGFFLYFYHWEAFIRVCFLLVQYMGLEGSLFSWFKSCIDPSRHCTFAAGAEGKLDTWCRCLGRSDSSDGLVEYRIRPLEDALAETCRPQSAQLAD